MAGHNWIKQYVFGPGTLDTFVQPGTAVRQAKSRTKRLCDGGP